MCSRGGEWFLRPLPSDGSCFPISSVFPGFTASVLNSQLGAFFYPGDLYRRAKAATVLIVGITKNSIHSRSTAVCLSRSGLVLTNTHVVERGASSWKHTHMQLGTASHLGQQAMCCSAERVVPQPSKKGLGQP